MCISLRHLITALSLTLALSASAQAADGPPDHVTAVTLGAGAVFSFLEIVASEACIQRLSCYEANRFMPDGRTQGATMGRAVIKGAGTSVVVYLLWKAKDAQSARTRWAALGGAVGWAVWNAYLTKRALDRFPQGGVTR